MGKVAAAAPVMASIGTAAKVVGTGMMIASALRGPGRAPNFGGGGAPPPGFNNMTGNGLPLPPRPAPLPEKNLPAHYIVSPDDWRAIPGTNRNGFFDSYIPTTDGYQHTASANAKPKGPASKGSPQDSRTLALADLLRKENLFRKRNNTRPGQRPIFAGGENSAHLYYDKYR